MPKRPIEQVKQILVRHHPQHAEFFDKIHKEHGELGEVALRSFAQYESPAIWAVMHAEKNEREDTIRAIQTYGRQGADVLMKFKSGLKALQKCEEQAAKPAEINLAMQKMNDHGVNAVKLIAQHGLPAVHALTKPNGRLFGELIGIIPLPQASELVEKINEGENVDHLLLPFLENRK